MVMKAYSAEFKADAVALYLSDPSHTFEGIGKDLGVSRETCATGCVRNVNAPALRPQRTGPGSRHRRAGYRPSPCWKRKTGSSKRRSASWRPSGKFCGGPRNISRARPTGEPLPVRRRPPQHRAGEVAVPDPRGVPIRFSPPRLPGPNVPVPTRSSRRGSVGFTTSSTAPTVPRASRLSCATPGSR